MYKFHSPPFLNFLRKARTNKAINKIPKILSNNTNHPEFIVNVRIDKSWIFPFKSAGRNWRDICVLVKISVESKNEKVTTVIKIHTNGNK